MNTLFLKSLVSASVLSLSFLFATPAVFAEVPTYCNTTGGIGYVVATSQASYSPGSAVHFCLADNTHNPLFLSGTHPWQITDHSGNTVYQPSTGSTTSTQPQSLFLDSWNGLNQEGSAVAPGSYHVVFPGLPGSPTATFVISQPVAYYPWGWPSTWYVLPGQTISFSGNGFAPLEQITLHTPTGVNTFSANSEESFSAQAPYLVPFSLIHSTQTFSITSSISSKTISWNIGVGTFYPNLNPSTYYIPKNSHMSASASSFAPLEPVQLLVNGNMLMQTPSDSGGGVSFNFLTPAIGQSFTLTTRGIWSNTESTRTISLAQ